LSNSSIGDNPKNQSRNALAVINTGKLPNFSHPIITRAMKGTRLKAMMIILYSARKEQSSVLNASLEIEKNLLFILKDKSAKKTPTIEAKISIAALIIVHHIKNALRAAISIIVLLFFNEINVIFSVI
jgi:hypothetical protein